MQMSSLYPIVQDLSDYENPCGYCCGDDKFGPFKISSLAKPTSNEPLTYHTDSPKPPKTHRREGTRTFGSLTSLFDRTESPTGSNTEDVPIRFDDSYVLTKLIENRLRSDLWECVHRQTKQRYCVKIYDMNKISSSSVRVAARREGMMLRKAQGHKNVVKLIDIIDDLDKVYIITELLDQQSLSERLRTNPTLPEPQVKRLAKSLFRAVEYIHGLGISHNSIEPSNILFDTKGSLKLCDFSEAAEASVSKDKGNNFDPANDIRSIGLVIYECLYGHRPTTVEIKSKRFFAKHDNCTRAAKRFLNQCLYVNQKQVPPTLESLKAHQWLSNKETPSLLPRLTFRKPAPVKRTSSAMSTSTQGSTTNNDTVC